MPMIIFFSFNLKYLLVKEQYLLQYLLVKNMRSPSSTFIQVSLQLPKLAVSTRRGVEVRSEISRIITMEGAVPFVQAEPSLTSFHQKVFLRLHNNLSASPQLCKILEFLGKCFDWSWLVHT